MSDPAKEYVDAATVCARLHLSKRTLDRFLADPRRQFPRPHYFGMRRFFRSDEVQAWAAAQRRERS